MEIVRVWEGEGLLLGLGRERLMSKEGKGGMKKHTILSEEKGGGGVDIWRLCLIKSLWTRQKGGNKERGKADERNGKIPKKIRVSVSNKTIVGEKSQ